MYGHVKAKRSDLTAFPASNYWNVQLESVHMALFISLIRLGFYVCFLDDATHGKGTIARGKKEEDGEKVNRDGCNAKAASVCPTSQQKISQLFQIIRQCVEIMLQII